MGCIRRALRVARSTMYHLTNIYRRESPRTRSARDFESIRLSVEEGEQRAFRSLGLDSTGRAPSSEPIIAISNLSENSPERDSYNYMRRNSPERYGFKPVQATRNIKKNNPEKPLSKLQKAKLRLRRQEEQHMEEGRRRMAEHRARRVRMARGASSSPDRTAKPWFTQQQTSSPTPPPKPVLQNLAHDISFYKKQPFEESHNYVQERLSNVLGRERMKFELLPSGHNPIDGVIAENSQQKITNDILEQWEQQKIELRCQAEEHQRLADEQRRIAEEKEAERLRVSTLLHHYRDKYVERLDKLTRFGANLAMGVDIIEAALLEGDLMEATRVISDFTHRVLLPIYYLLAKCEKEIPLEEVGAYRLKHAWPLKRLEAMYEYLERERALYVVNEMMEGLEAICRPVRNPTPFNNPLDPQQALIDDSPSNVPFGQAEPAADSLFSEEASALLATPTPIGRGLSKLLKAAAQAANNEKQKGPATAEAISNEESTTSAPAESGFVKLLAATADKLKPSQAEGSFNASGVPSNNNVPSDSFARTDILQYIAADNVGFESEIQEMFKRNNVVRVHRRRAIETLKELISLANFEKGILGEMDAGNFRSSIESCVTKIDALPNPARWNKDTRDLRKLCGEALMLWSFHAR